MKTRYVLGFLFDDELESVVLIEKQRPKWQKGSLNGVGGRCEVGETSHEAMEREFKEETGQTLVSNGWFLFLEMTGPDWSVDCFAAANGRIASQVKTVTDEKVTVVDAFDFNQKQVISNLRWIVPMAKNFLHEDFYAKINYRK